jgi:hypothetical protein
MQTLQTVAVTSKSTYNPPDTPSQTITYLTLAKVFTAGSLVITAGATSFSYALPAAQYGSVTVANKNPISPLIYGINFVADAVCTLSYREELKVKLLMRMYL